MQSTTRRVIILWLVLVLGLICLAPSPRSALSQSPTAQKIESDAPTVTRAGHWTSQAVASASGGRYLYSSGSTADVLTLSFSGPSIEVIYVAGPQLGTLAINVDDTVLRTVITTANKTAYQQSSRIDYLSNQTHTLKVYAQKGGVVAVDAFVIPTASTPSTVNGAMSQTRTTACAPIHAVQWVTQTSTGTPGNGDSYSENISSDGRYVTFHTVVSFVPGDGDTLPDIYTYDRQTCTLELSSVSSTGVKNNNESYQPTVSADGRYIAFISNATNLSPNDTNGSLDIYLHDRTTGTTEVVSLATGGVQSPGGNAFDPALSADSRYVAFESSSTLLVANDTNTYADIFVRDRQTSTTTRVSVATGGTQATGGDAYHASISADGRYVAFESNATNLVASDTNGLTDIFVHDRQTTTTTRISVATGGTQAIGGNSTVPAITPDGRYIVYHSDATNLVAGDTNGAADAFMYDRQTGTTTRISVATGGAQGNGASFEPSISSDGRFVAFNSTSTNFAPGDTNAASDIFVMDRQTNTTTRISLTANGGQTIGGVAFHAKISADGNYVAYLCNAPNLVVGNSTTFSNVYLTPRVLTTADNLALFNPPFQFVALLSTLADNPPASAYTAFSAYAPVSGGQWVMGDWNGDGLDTPGVYANGPFFYTNKSGESRPSDWRSLWIGIAGPPIAGHFNASLPNDCIGAVNSAYFPPYGTAFVYYFTCDLSGNTAPAISYQWLSVVLSDVSGFSGVHQFSAGDFNGDGLDSIAVRRGTYIAFGNVPPTIIGAAFDLAQYIGAPSATDAGTFVVGDWDANGVDSFGLFYQNGELFYRNDLTFNSGVYINQSVGTPFGSSGVQVATWR